MTEIDVTVTETDVAVTGTVAVVEIEVVVDGFEAEAVFGSSLQIWRAKSGLGWWSADSDGRSAVF